MKTTILALLACFIANSALAEDDIIFKFNDSTQFSSRYRVQTKSDGALSHNTLQQQVLLDVTIAFFKDRVRIDFEGSTGSSFDGGWGDTGIGSADPNMAFFLRRLSMTLSPVSGLELTVGSMAPKYGAGSENSYYDNDGYIMGYRARVAIDKGDIVVTGGYVGDYKNPNIFDRFGRLAEFNYLQAVITRSIGEIVRASLDYNYIEGEHYARAALQFDVSKWAKFLDTITLEDMVGVKSLGGADKANVLAFKLSKRFADVFAGRDITAALTYTYRTDAMKLPIGDKVFDGQAVRLNIAIPNLVATARAKLGVYFDYVQSLTDFARVRVELGLMLKF